MHSCNNFALDLEDFRRPEAGHPEEAPLGLRRPHAGHEVEDVGPGEHGPQVEQLVVVPLAGFDNGADVRVEDLGLQSALNLRHVLVVFV